MLIFFFVLGTVFGSFGNVLIYRLPLNQSILFPFSFCPNCKEHIKWYYNIPVISFFILSGKCKSCGQKISFIYPFVEFVCGLMAVLLFFKFENYVYTMIFFNLSFVLFVIAVIDYKTMEVPDVLSNYLIISGCLVSIINPVFGDNLVNKVMNSLLGGMVGYGVIFLIEHIGNKIFKKPAIGYADVKIFAAIGLYLGYLAIFKILFFASVIATIYVLFLSFKSKENIFGKYIPFAPFIFLGTFGYIIFYLNVK